MATVSRAGCCADREPRGARFRYIAASQIGITLTSLILGALTDRRRSTPDLAPLLAQWFRPHHADGAFRRGIIGAARC